jgi:hypothetical protein
MTPAELAYWKDLASIVQSVFTTIGIVVAGAWAFHRFCLRRERAPRVNLVHKISDRPIIANKRLLHVEAEMSNLGDVIFSVGSGLTCVQQILPILNDLETKINNGADPVPEGKTEIDWPLITELKKTEWPAGEFEIEPGETDSVHYDFLIDADIKTVAIYSCFDQIKKHKKKIEWEVTTIYDISKNNNICNDA